MKVSLLVVISITLVMIGQAHSGKKQCMGDDGNKYDIGQSYKDLVVCVKYTCKKKGKKMKMVPKPIPNCVPEENLAANVTALEAQLENLETMLTQMMSGMTSKCDTATCTSIQDSAHQVGSSAAYYNYLDEMATSACVGMSVGHGRGGHMTAIRRDCSASKDTCNQVCQNAPINNSGITGMQSGSWVCFDSIHVYKHHPRLTDNSKGYTDSGKVGPVVYRYNSCEGTFCGPNYCCCVTG